MSAYKIKTTISYNTNALFISIQFIAIIIIISLLLRHSSGIHLKNLLFHHLTIEHCHFKWYFSVFKSINYAFILLFDYTLLCCRVYSASRDVQICMPKFVYIVNYTFLLDYLPLYLYYVVLHGGVF